jgi:outer membrane lipoprotein carrier protein
MRLHVATGSMNFFKMPNKTILSVLILLLAAGLAVAQKSTNDLARLADKVDRHYNHLKSMRAEFAETYNGVGIAKSESGTLWLKQPGKMRWEYTEPRKKLFVSDGKTAWFYVPGEQQARKAPVSKIDDIRSPMRFLLGKTKLMKEFDQLGFASDIKPDVAGDVVLKGVPKNMEDRVAFVAFEVSPEGRIDSITIKEVDDAVTRFRFSEQQENVPVADSLFNFRPPSGVEIVDANVLGN